MGLTPHLSIFVEPSIRPQPESKLCNPKGTRDPSRKSVGEDQNQIRPNTFVPADFEIVRVDFFDIVHVVEYLCAALIDCYRSHTVA